MVDCRGIQRGHRAASLGVLMNNLGIDAAKIVPKSVNDILITTKKHFLLCKDKVFAKYFLPLWGKFSFEIYD